MDVLLAYGRMYGECLRKAFRGIGKNLWTLALPFVVQFLMYLALPFIAPAGRAAGFAFAAVFNALASVYLHFVAEVVGQTKASVSSFGKSFLTYFWPLVGVGFVLWIGRLLLAPMLATNPNAGKISLLLVLVVGTLLSAVPEVIYLKGAHGLGAITASVEFLQSHWIEWLLPHALLGALVYFGIPFMAPLVSVRYGVGLATSIGSMLLGGAVFHVFMVFRGHLFEVLDSTSHRQRLFRYRASK